MIQPDSCLDYDPTLDKRRYTPGARPYLPYGSHVADSIERCLLFFSPPGLLQETDINRLRQEALHARTFGKDIPDTNRSDIHPIRAEIAKQSPIYSCLAEYAVTPDHIEVEESLPPGKTVGDIARIAALITYLDLKTPTRLDPREFANFSRKISRTAPEVKVLLFNACGDIFSEFFDVKNAIHHLNTTFANTHTETAQRADIVRLSQKLIDILHFLEPMIELRRELIKSHEPADETLAEIKDRLTSQSKAGKAHPDSELDDEETGTALFHFDSENEEGASFTAVIDEEPQSKSSASLAEYGQWVHFTDILSGSGRQRATDLEAQATYQYLKNMTLDSEHMEAARWLTMVGICNMRGYEQLANIIKSPEKQVGNGQIQELKILNNDVTLLIKHPVASKLAKSESSTVDENLNTNFELFTHIPSHINSKKALEIVKKTDVESLKNAKKALRKLIRENAYREFTENRLKGALIHKIFQENHDVQIAQLLSNERLGLNYAALHYIAITNTELQEKLARARLSVFGGRLSSSSSYEPPRHIVGSNKAIENGNALIACSEWFCKKRQEVNSRGKQAWHTRHNNIALTTQHILFVSTAHRGNKDFEQLRLTDLSLSAGLILYSDKPSDVSILRRLTTLSPMVVNYLCHYLEHLISLTKIRNIPIPRHIQLTAMRALSSEGPLFFHVDADNKFATDVIDPLETIRTLAPSVSRDFCRHLQSTEMRALNPPPSALMLETHLGHNLQLTLTNRNGLLAPQDLSVEMGPYIDQWLSNHNYPPSKPCKIPNLTDFLPKQPDLLAKQVYDKDTTQARNLLKTEFKDSTQKLSLRRQIDLLALGYEHQMKNAADKTLSTKTITKLRSELINQLPHDVFAWASACRLLAKKVRLIHRQNDWPLPKSVSLDFIFSPPTKITQGHFAAFEHIKILRDQFIKIVDQPIEKSSLFTLSTAALVLFHHCNSFAEAKQWLSILSKGKPQETEKNGNGFLLFNLSEAEGSRTITGIPLIFITSWLRSRRGKNRINLKNIGLPSEKRIESLTHLAREIELPTAFTKVINGTLVTRELHASRLKAFLHGSCSPNADVVTQSTQEGRRRREIDPAPDNPLSRSHFIHLRRLIQSGTKTHTTEVNCKSRISMINDWIYREKLDGLPLLYAQWAISLLSPGANRKTTYDLVEKTVLDHLRHALTVLVDLKNDYLDPEFNEELSDLLNARIEKIHTSPDLCAASTYRFFVDMGKKYLLPQVSIQTVRDSQKNIDASVITNAEISVAQNHLQKWSELDEIPPAYQEALFQASEALTLNCRNTGLRRSELLGMPPINSGNIKVRLNSVTKLKTDNAYRNWTVSENLPLPSGDPHFQFPGLAKSATSPFAMKAVKNALQLATANPNSQLHHSRHTVGSMGALAVCRIQTGSERLISGAKLAAQLGHAGFEITLHYYSHLTRHALAMRVADNVFLLSDRTISNLLGGRKQSVNQRRRRYKDAPGHFIAVCINESNSYVKENIKVNAPTKIFLEKPNYLPTEVSDLTPATCAQWIYDRMIGTPINSPKSLVHFPDHINHELLVAAKNFELQSHSRLINLLNLESDISTIENPQTHSKLRRRRARIPNRDILARVINLKNSKPISPSLLPQLSHIPWVGNNIITIRLSLEDAEELEAFLSEVKADLAVNQTQPESYQIHTKNWESRQITNKIFRILILASILLNHVTRDTPQ